MSFEDKNGLESVDDFKTANYGKTQFIPHFNFPLPNKAEINCNKTVLSKLGYDEYIDELNTVC